MACCPDEQPSPAGIAARRIGVFQNPADPTDLTECFYESCGQCMREILTQPSPTGQFSVRLPDTILRIWRLPA